MSGFAAFAWTKQNKLRSDDFFVISGGGFRRLLARHQIELPAPCR
jgi:hypothetical protein